MKLTPGKWLAKRKVPCGKKFVEGAQYAMRGLPGFLKVLKHVGADGGQPTLSMLTKEDNTLMTAQEVTNAFEAEGLLCQHFSDHADMYVFPATALESKEAIAWCIPPDLLAKGFPAIQQAMEDNLMRAIDLAAEMPGNGIIHGFWGITEGVPIAGGVSFPFFAGKTDEGEFDLQQRRMDRFLTITEKVRNHARASKVKFGHENHPNTMAWHPQEMLDLNGADDNLVSAFDPSQYYGGIEWYDAFDILKDIIWLVHFKNFWRNPRGHMVLARGDWMERPGHFTGFDPIYNGMVNLTEFIHFLVSRGVVQRYIEKTGNDFMPFTAETEHPWRPITEVLKEDLKLIEHHGCCVPGAGFEAEMGT